MLSKRIVHRFSASQSLRVLPPFIRRVILIAFLIVPAAQAEVQLTGVNKDIAATILGYLQLDDEPCDAPKWRVRRLFAAAEQEIRSALEVSGYYAVTIEQELQQQEACWQADFRISLGEPVRLRQVLVSADTGSKPDTAFYEAIKECALQPDDVLSHASYEACKQRIARVAEDRGYFSGSFEVQKVDVYPEEYVADITLRYLSGPRYTFGSVSFEQDVLDPDLAERYVEFQPGEPYDAKRVRDLQLDLASSRYFDQINVSTLPRGAPHFDVPVLISLTPGQSRQFTYGLGYATDLGVRARFGALNRRRNTRGHQSELEVSASEVLSEAVLSYRIPLDRPAAESFAVSTGYRIEDTDTTTSDLFTSGLSLSKKLNNDWIRKWFVDVRLEDYTAGAIDSGYSKLLLPGLGYGYATSDFPPRPLTGHRSGVYVRGASDVFISDTSFVQFYAQSKRIFGLWKGGRVLVRGEYGTTFIDGLVTLPTSVRYFAGGDVSVRGYGFKDLGPEDEFGEVVGGKHVITGSVELDQRVAQNWSVAAFVDSGNAFDDYNDINFATGVGAGVRWYSIVGPIRFDIAVPLESNAPDDYRIVITMGPDL
jgi:translocation and assembly module TamA